MAKKESVKSVCEAGIRKGSGKGVIMNSLRKKFDKDDATYEKSIKYYASALHRQGEIDDEAKAKYVGAGKVSKASKPAKTKAVSKKSDKGTAKPASKKKTASKRKSTAKSKAKSTEKPAAKKTRKKSKAQS